jgi:hypothetical protein
MEIGTLILHRFNGDEIYQIKNATIKFFDDADCVKMFIHVTTTETPIQTLPDTVSLRQHPNAEIEIDLGKGDTSNLVGQRFSVPLAYSEKEEEYVATMYYCEHGDLNENLVSVVDRRDNKFLIHWTGTTTDVNHYDGSKPKTMVEIKGWFELKSNK